MEKDIQLFLISGFLGSGKTTFLKNVLTNLPDCRTGVIVNEFGSIGIDGKILNNQDVKMVEINNGSIFCACLKGGFLKTLAAFLEQPVDYLFVEASGLADPSDMGHILEGVEAALARKPHIERRYNYRGSICIVDAVNFFAYQEIFPTMNNQLRKSNFILLNKIDDVTEEDKEELIKNVGNVNSKAYIYPTNYGEVPIDILNSRLSIENYVEDSTNTPGTRPITYIIHMPKVDNVECVKQFVTLIGPFTLRMKGFCEMKNGQCFIDGVDTRIKVKTYPRDYLEDPIFKLVVIGKDQVPFRKVIEAAWKKSIKLPLVMEEE